MNETVKSRRRRISNRLIWCASRLRNTRISDNVIKIQRPEDMALQRQVDEIVQLLESRARELMADDHHDHRTHRR